MRISQTDAQLSHRPTHWCEHSPTCAISPAGAKVTSGQSAGSAPSRYSAARAALFCIASTAGSTGSTCILRRCCVCCSLLTR